MEEFPTNLEDLDDHCDADDQSALVRLPIIHSIESNTVPPLHFDYLTLHLDSSTISTPCQGSDSVSVHSVSVSGSDSDNEKENESSSFNLESSLGEVGINMYQIISISINLYQIKSSQVVD